MPESVSQPEVRSGTGRQSDGKAMVGVEPPAAHTLTFFWKAMLENVLSSNW